MLCDIRMPGTSGVDLVPQAIEIEPELAILMLTAVNDATSAALCMQRGAMDYLTKPIELADLGRAVQRALKRREMLLENRQLNQWLKEEVRDRKSTRLNSSHANISYAVFCLKKKKKKNKQRARERIRQCTTTRIQTDVRTQEPSPACARYT